MRIVCYYHNDPDGRLSGYLVRRYSENNLKCPFIGVALEYKDQVQIEDIIQPDDYVFIVDFTFKIPDLQRVLAITKNVVWIDHHRTSIGVYDQILEKPLAGVHDIRYAGCVLTYWYLFRADGTPMYRHEFAATPFSKLELPADFETKAKLDQGWIPDYVLLTGDYDAWRWEFREDTEPFYAGIQLYNTMADKNCIWEDLDKSWQNRRYEPTDSNMPKLSRVTDRIKVEGQMVLQYKRQFAKEYRETWGYWTQIGLHRAYACNLARPSSQFFTDMWEDIDVAIGFVWSGDRYQVSLYSENPNINVGEIAKQFGGGGHIGAAGFECKELPFKKTDEPDSRRAGRLSAEVANHYS